MRLFGYEFFTKAQNLSAIDSTRGGWFRVLESYSGAWQQNVVADNQQDLMAFSALFAVCTGISGDVSKMRVKLVQENLATGICTELVGNTPYLQVLRKPNRYQNRIAFFQHWMLSKLLFGNTYVLKERDGRGIVNALYVLDPQRVVPLVADDGGVYYRLSRDNLSGIPDALVMPASEIIHDRWNCMWHPLVGISPIYACAVSATQGRRIQANSTKFFSSMSHPTGILVSPGKLDDEAARNFKKNWDANYGPNGVGGTAVLSGGLEYKPMAVPADDAQLIEQLKWTVEDIARCFHVPLFKLGGPIPPNNSVEALNQQYYSDCLQILIESAELCLDEGLALPSGYYTEFDLDGLLRMDTEAQVKALAEEVKAGIRAPDEARQKRNLAPVPGGKYPYLQQQNFSLEALAKRDAQADPFATSKPEPKPAPAANDEEAAAEQARQLLETIQKGLANV